MLIQSFSLALAASYLEPAFPEKALRAAPF